MRLCDRRETIQRDGDESEKERKQIWMKKKMIILSTDGIIMSSNIWNKNANEIEKAECVTLGRSTEREKFVRIWCTQRHIHTHTRTQRPPFGKTIFNMAKVQKLIKWKTNGHDFISCEYNGRETIFSQKQQRNKTRANEKGKVETWNDYHSYSHRTDWAHKNLLPKSKHLPYEFNRKKSGHCFVDVAKMRFLFKWMLEKWKKKLSAQALIRIWRADKTGLSTVQRSDFPVSSVSNQTKSRKTTPSHYQVKYHFANEITIWFRKIYY